MRLDENNENMSANTNEEKTEDSVLAKTNIKSSGRKS